MTEKQSWVGTEKHSKMRLRVRAPSGQHTVEIDADATIGDLKALIAEKAGVVVPAQELLAGFPPKKVTAGGDDTCSSAGIAQGELITVNELELAAPEPIPELEAAEPPRTGSPFPTTTPR